MNVIFETSYLAPGQAQAAKNVRFNARQVIDEAQFFRAATATYYPRGNVECSFEFVTQWIFTTAAQAEQFVLSSGSAYPMTNADNGVLQVVIGAETATPQTIYSPSAVLEEVEVLDYIGRSVDVRYKLRCQPFTVTAPPFVPSLPPSDTSMYTILRGVNSIGSGATTLAISFGSVFSTLPVGLTATMSQQSGSQAIFCRILDNTITTSGFTVEFSAPLPDSSSKVRWVAVQ